MTDQPVEAPASVGSSYPGRARRAVTLGIVFCAASLGLFAIVRWVTPLNQRRGTRHEFEDIWCGLRNYSGIKNRLPFPVTREPTEEPTGPGAPNGTDRPLYSWRFALVPWRGYSIGEGRWDRSRAWDSPANREMLHFGVLYSYSYEAPVDSERVPQYTNVLAITGPGTAFGCDDEPPRALDKVSPATIIIVESRASGIHWAEPGDLDIRNMPESINGPDGKGISSRHPGGFHVLFADGQVWFLSEKTPFGTLKQFFTIESAAKCSREAELGPYAY